MDRFPDIKIASSENFKIVDPYVEDEFESGEVAVRPVFSKERLGDIAISWSAMNKADLEVLRSFYSSHRGKSFVYPDPASKSDIVCTFISDCLKWDTLRDLPGFFSVSLTIRPNEKKVA